MAAEEFMLNINADFSKAERAAAEFYAKNKARAAEAAKANPTAPLAQLPKEAKNRLADSSKSEKLATAELSKQQNIQAEIIKQKATLIALAQKEAEVTARAAGRNISKKDLLSIRNVGEESLAGNLGLDKLTPAIKGQLTKTIATIEAQFSTALAGLSGEQLQRGFQKTANPLLVSAGVTQKASVAQASTQLSRATDLEDSSLAKINADIQKSKTRERSAAAESATAATKEAKDATESAEKNRRARSRTTKALNEQAVAAEKSAAATAADLKFKRTPSGTIIAPVPGAVDPDLDRYQIDKVDAGGGYGKGYSLTYPGQRTPDDVYATQREAKAAAQTHLDNLRELASITEAEVVNEAESLSLSEAQNQAEAQTLAAERELTAATQAAAAQQLKFNRDYAKGGMSSYSTVSDRSNKGYLINKESPTGRYEIYDEEQDRILSQKFDKLQDAKDKVQSIEDARVAAAQQSLSIESENVAIEEKGQQSKAAAAGAAGAEATARQAAASTATKGATLAESLLAETASSKAAQEKYTSAVQQLSAAQQKALAAVIANPNSTRAELGVPANTLKSLQSKGFVEDIGFERIAAVNAEIFVAKQAQLAETVANTGAEAASASITASSVLTEKEIEGLLAKMRAAIAAGTLNAQEASAQLARIGIPILANSLAPAAPKTPKPNATALSAADIDSFDEAEPIKEKKRTRRTSTDKTREAEDELLDALNGKSKSLRAQKKLIDVRLPKLRAAEDALIKALNGKASSLASQTKASKTRDKKIKDGENKKANAAGKNAAEAAAESGGPSFGDYKPSLTPLEPDAEFGFTPGELEVYGTQIKALAQEEIFLRKQSIDLLAALIRAQELLLVSQAGIQEEAAKSAILNDELNRALLQQATAERVLANKRLAMVSQNDDALAAIAEGKRLKADIDRRTGPSPEERALQQRVDQQAVRESISPQEAADQQISIREAELRKLRGLEADNATQARILAVEAEIFLLKKIQLEAMRKLVLGTEANARAELERARNNAVQKAVREKAVGQVERENLGQLGQETADTRRAARTGATKTLSTGRVVPDVNAIDESLLDAKAKEFRGRRLAGIALAKQVAFEEEANRLAALRNQELLRNGGVFTKYNQAVEFLLAEELQIINLQKKKLDDEIKSGKLSQDEVRARQQLIADLNAQARAARAVAENRAKPGRFVEPNAEQAAAARRTAAIQNEAKFRNISQLGGGVAPAYSVADISTGKLNVEKEKQILKEQIALADSERENAKLSQQERQARTLLVKELRSRQAALVAADKASRGEGSGPRKGSDAERFYVEDPARVQAEQQRMAAEQTARQRQAEAARINRERSKDPFAFEQKQQAIREAALRASGVRQAKTSAQLDALGTTALQLEKETIAQQIKILKSKAVQASSSTQKAAIEKQIDGLQKQEADLRRRINRSLAASGAPPVPPTKPPRTTGGTNNPGNSFGASLKDAPGAAGFFGGGLLTTLKYSLPSLLLFSAGTGIIDAIREAEELQYVLSKLQSQVDAVFKEDGAEAVKVFKDAIIGVSIEAGLAADELGKVALKITGTFSKKTIGGETGIPLVEKQIVALGKLQRVTGLTAKELENDYSAISLAFDTNFSDIADKVVAISDVTGIDAAELGNFAGDIATVLTDAGFTLEQSLALGATSAQSSGKSITAISEAYGRVIPQLANQTAELSKLAASETALDTPEFIDAVRLQDASKILTIIGQQYNNLSKSGQVKLTELFGRRETQNILPGLQNQQGYNDALDAAENSTGRFQERFETVMQNLSAKLAKLGEEVRIVFKKLLEGGLGDVLEGLLTIGSLIANGLSTGIGALTKLNDVLGGLPVKILAVAAAWKVMQASSGFLSAVTGRIGAGGAATGFANVAPSFLAQGQFAYQNRLNPRMLPQGYQGPQLPPVLANQRMLGTKPAAFGAGIAAGGKGLLTGLGGGSLALGGAFVGITALTTLYQQINSRIEADKAAMAELRDEIQTETAALDLADEDVRNSRVKELERLSDTAAEDVAGFKDDWKRFWDGLFNIQSEAAVYAIEAIRASRDPEIDKELSELNNIVGNRIVDTFTTEGLDIDLSGLEAAAQQKDVLGEGPGDFIAKALDDLFGIDPSNWDPFGSVQPSATADSSSAVRELLDVSSLQDANEEVLKALDSEDRVAALREIVNTSEDQEAVEQAANALDNIAEELLTGNSRAAKAYRFLKARAERRAAELEELKNSKSISDLGELASAYEAGVITLEEYLRRSDEEIGNIEDSLRPGGETEASEQDQLAAATAIKEGRQRQTQAILEAQEKQIKIAEALGAKPADIDAAKIAAARANLADPNFTNEDERLAAALLLVQAEGAAQLAIARRTGDLQKVYDLINNGFEIPADTMAILLKETVQNDDQYKEIEEAYNKYIESSFGSILPGALSGEDGRGLNADDLLSKVATETFSEGGLTDQTKQGLLNSITNAQTQLDTQENLRDEVREALENSVDYWVELLQLGGVATEEILNALSAGEYANTLPGSDERTAIESKFAELLEGYGFNPEQIKAMIDAQNLADAKALETARADFYKATGNNAGYLEALQARRVINQPAADAARAKPVLERTKEDWDALKEEAEIDNEIKDLADRIRNAKQGYLKAVLKSQGDEIGAINVDLAEARRDLQDARDRQDEEAEAIALQQITELEDQKADIYLSYALSGFDLAKGIAELSGDNAKAGQIAIQKAQAALAAAKTPSEKNAALLELLRANQEAIKLAFEDRARDFDLFAAYLESNGNSFAAVKTRLEKAKAALESARKTGNKNDINAALIDLLNQEAAFRKAQDEEATKQSEYLSALQDGDDPIKRAIREQADATAALARAVGPDEIRDATIRLNNANRELANARNDARTAMMTLRQAEAQAMGDEVAAAQIGVEIARQQLNDLIKAGAGAAAIANGRIALVNADKAAKDAVFQERQDEYKWLLDMGKISKSQYINYLEGLKSTLIPGTRQFKDLELTIKQLKNDIGGDLQANLPTSLRLPTLYEVRRFDQTPQSAGTAGRAGGIGYQDNRQVSIQVEINNATQDVQTVLMRTLEDAIGTGRNGYGERRY